MNVRANSSDDRDAPGRPGARRGAEQPYRPPVVVKLGGSIALIRQGHIAMLRDGVGGGWVHPH